MEELIENEKLLQTSKFIRKLTWQKDLVQYWDATSPTNVEFIMPINTNVHIIIDHGFSQNFDLTSMFYLFPT